MELDVGVGVGKSGVDVTVRGIALGTEIKVGVVVGALQDVINSRMQSERRVDRRMMF